MPNTLIPLFFFFVVVNAVVFLFSPSVLASEVGFILWSRNTDLSGPVLLVMDSKGNYTFVGKTNTTPSSSYSSSKDGSFLFSNAYGSTSYIGVFNPLNAKIGIQTFADLGMTYPSVVLHDTNLNVTLITTTGTSDVIYSVDDYYYYTAYLKLPLGINIASYSSWDFDDVNSLLYLPVTFNNGSSQLGVFDLRAKTLSYTIPLPSSWVTPSLNLFSSKNPTFFYVENYRKINLWDPRTGNITNSVDFTSFLNNQSYTLGPSIVDNVNGVLYVILYISPNYAVAGVSLKDWSIFWVQQPQSQYWHQAIGVFYPK